MPSRIFFDIETTSFFGDPLLAQLPREQQLLAIRFGLATAFDGATWHATADAACCWQLLAQHDRLIGWNVQAFDLPVLWRALGLQQVPVAQYLALYARTCDLFAVIKETTQRWYKLQAVTEPNLGRGKSGTGNEAAQWLRSGDPALVERARAYCRDDVQLVVDLVAHLEQGKPLRLPARPERRGEFEDLQLSYRPDGRWVLESASGRLSEYPAIAFGAPLAPVP